MAHTIAVLSQPPNQYNAILGGLVAARLHALNVTGVVVDGRVRDITQLLDLPMPVFSRGVSTIGAGGASRAEAMNVPVMLRSGVTVNPVTNSGGQ